MKSQFPAAATVRSLAVRLIVAVALSAAACPAARAEVFVLATGGRIEGQWLNPHESPRTKFVIKTAAGSLVTLQRSQVKEVLRDGGAQSEYERIRPRYPDTVEGQWALAEWCREHRLTGQRKTHLERTIELDGDHAPARHALGYSRQDGKWKIREEVMLKRGFVRFERTWKTPQERELILQQRKTTKAQGEWTRNLKRWTRSLGGSRDADARRSIRTIDDPLAVKGLISCLSDDRSQVRILLIDVLAKIDAPEAVSELTVRSLQDPVLEVRLTCLDHLKQHDGPAPLVYFVRALASSDNTTVNRAAVALGHLKDPSAVGPLIAALVTTHKQKISAGNPGSLSPTFGVGPGGRPGPSGLSVGGRPKIVTYQVRNQAVLDALIALTGVNYGFQPQAWNDWLASQRETHAVNLRRD